MTDHNEHESTDSGEHTHFHFHFHHNGLAAKQTGAIMTKLSELASVEGAILAQLDKAHGEIVGLINDLANQLTNVDIPADAQATLDQLAATAQVLDDIVPDAPPPAA